MSTRNVTRNINSVVYTVQEPTLCPHCSNTIFAEIRDSKKFFYETNFTFWTLSYCCPNPGCNKIFLATFLSENKSKTLDLISIYPTKLTEELHPLLHELSPRFIKSYRQANLAENNGSFELAGAGYRNALEILIKDFAIIELNQDPTEVSKKKLHVCIKEYLGDVDLTKCANVVRILGNDNTHYERKYEELDFEVLKTYMNIFIRLITTKLLINHPPVGNH